MSTSKTSDSSARPLYLWPKGADLELIKQAVIDAKLGFKVRPFWYEPGHHERLIVLDEGFDQIGPEYVYPKSEKTRVMSVRWFFGLEDLPIVHTALTDLQKVFGEGVVEREGPFDDVDASTQWGDNQWP